ncbi:ABC transporter ATP-binding protein [Paenibacillus sp. 32O-W]|uniref:ABC transporter ATP-binding protein n=1 Tax=Paenibacillus sp. 32O-W TaxID=1695218 RepID=UPI000784BAD6|nr:ABC transporter ATP-binding protein [Paenibacillus sp. 32O-W]
MDMMETSNKPGSWRRLWNLILQAEPPKLLLLTALLLSVMTTLAGLILPLFTKDLVDGFSAASLDRKQIVALGTVFLAQAIAGGLSVYMLNLGGNRVVAAIRERLWRKMLALPVAYFDRHKTGETISRMTNDTAVVKGLVAEHFASFCTGILSVAGALAIMLTMDWRMTAIMLLVFPVTALMMMPVGRAMFRISKGMQEETARFTAVLNRVLSEIRLVKASGSEPVEYVQGADGIEKLFRFGRREGRAQAVLSPLVSFVILLLLVTIIGYGGAQVSAGAITAGELVAFILYLFQIVMPLTQITHFFTQLQKAKGATESIIEILESEEEDLESGERNVPEAGTIEVDRVSFAYKANEPVLKNVSFTIEHGKKTAIVGPSGSGKTTLFSLLERFYAPDEGAIRFGGRGIETYALSAWRRKLGYVSQECPIIAGTIRENIGYGVDRIVSDRELEEAARLAYADEFIRQLPEGYDTEVGERGIKLSGGQRQRIAIARALLRNPDILMLDEATSSLDSRSEAVVQQALSNLMAGRTTIIIAHRLATVADADRIVFLDKGRVTGIGTHDELYRSHATYREFADRQLKLDDSAAS